MARILSGTRMGPYEVVSFLAAGGMGEVYRGFDARLGRPVAIKVLPEDSFRDDEAIRRFEREARAAAAVSHPNLVSIYDVGQAGANRYLVMDLLEGQSLRDVLGAGPMPWENSVKLAIDVATGIAAVHAKGFVHRDLKPENIFITSDGWVKLLDFGLAVPRLPMLDPAPADLTVEMITQRGVIVGTLAYMAPEQLRGEELDARADIFAAGCVLYEMLAGSSAFGGATAADMIAAVLTRQVTLPQTVPAELQRIVRRCLATSREQRFQSANELAHALRQIAASGAAMPEPLQSIAVLPFANLANDRENDYFSEGLSEEILNALTHVPDLKVTARTSAFAFRGRHEDVRRIGEALRVKTILEGGVRRDGNRVRVTVQLIDAASGFHLWSERYDRAMTDVFAVQDEIASAIVEKLQLRLAPRARSAATPDLAAFHAYLKSRYHFGKLTPQQLILSQAEAEEAIARDPDYSPALAQLAECLVQSAVYGSQEGTQAVPKARAAALQAVAIDESEASAHMTLARIAGEFDFDWQEALRRCRLALACDRISPAVRALCAQFVLWPLGRGDELAAAIEPAVSADPLSPMPRCVMAQALTARHDYDGALALMASVLVTHAHFWPGHLASGGIYCALDRVDEAIAILEKGFAVASWNTAFSGLLAGVHARAGNGARSEELLAHARAQQSPSLRALGESTYHFARGELDPAAAHYERVIDGRYPVAAYYFQWMCLSDEFRASAGGQRLRRKLNLVT